MNYLDNFYVSSFGEYCDDLIACLDLLDSFEKGEVDLFSFEYKICIATSNVHCLNASKPMEEVINQLFEEQKTFAVQFSQSQRADFVKKFFPNLKKEIKNAFERCVRFQIKAISPIPLEVLDESWIYCPNCVDSFNGEESKIFFVKLAGHSPSYLFCPKCFLPMESKEDFLELLNQDKHYLGVFLNQKSQKVLAKL